MVVWGERERGRDTCLRTNSELTPNYTRYPPHPTPPQGERFPVSIYLSLIPTVIGVALASASDVSFDPSGLIAAIGSAMAQTLLNVMSKKASEATGVNG